MALFMVCVILVCGVFLELFFILVGLNFSVLFLVTTYGHVLSSGAYLH